MQLLLCKIFRNARWITKTKPKFLQVRNCAVSCILKVNILYTFRSWKQLISSLSRIEHAPITKICIFFHLTWAATMAIIDEAVSMFLLFICTNIFFNCKMFFKFKRVYYDCQFAILRHNNLGHNNLLLRICWKIINIMDYLSLLLLNAKFWG